MFCFLCDWWVDGVLMRGMEKVFQTDGGQSVIET